MSMPKDWTNPRLQGLLAPYTALLFYRIFLAIAFRVLTLATSATLVEYSGAEKYAPMVTLEFLKENQ